MFNNPYAIDTPQLSHAMPPPVFGLTSVLAGAPGVGTDAGGADEGAGAEGGWGWYVESGTYEERVEAGAAGGWGW